MSSSSHNPAYVPGPRFGFVKLLALSGSHCTKWADEQHRPVGFESRLVPDLPIPFIPTLIGLRAFDHVSSRVWWKAVTNKQSEAPKRNNGRLEAVRLPVSTGLPPGGWAALLTPFDKLGSSGSHCTKWVDEQQRPAGFESRLVPDLPLPLSPL